MGNTTSQQSTKYLSRKERELNQRERWILDKERILASQTASKPNNDSHPENEQKLQRREEELANAESNVLPYQRSVIKTMKPGHFREPSDDLPEHYNVGFFGMVNAGKSSLLNSIFYAVKGEYPGAEKVPVAPSDHKGLHTKRTYAIHITEHVCLVDTPGIIPERMRKHEEAVMTEIKSRLERGGSLGSRNDISKMRVDEIHCAVVVISPDEMFETRELHGKLITLIENHLGSQPLAIITHGDISTFEKIKSTRGFLRSKGISDIYEIENMHEHHFEKKYQVALLNFLARCVCVSDRKTTMPHDQSDEQDD